MSDTIEVGNSVHVMSIGVGDMSGKVLYIPQAIGDSWRIRGNNGCLHYVETFSVMTKLK